MSGWVKQVSSDRASDHGPHTETNTKLLQLHQVRLIAVDLRARAGYSARCEAAGAAFAVDFATAEQRFTTTWQGERILRRKKDPIFGKACKFLDPLKRQCTIYDARPLTCRQFPARERCAYYDLLQFERSQQGDDTVLPLIQITFRNGD